MNPNISWDLNLEECDTINSVLEVLNNIYKHRDHFYEIYYNFKQV